MFVNGVTVVLCGDEQSFQGATIAWPTKIEKNHVMVSLPSKALVTKTILAKKVFSISVLSDGQSDIAKQFDGSKQTQSLPQNIGSLDFELWEVPVVKNCRAHLLCNTIQDISVKEQTVVIASVTEVGFC
ncbi:MAG: flavin reductase [Arenicellales bacterium]|nr:flavin reductase [Arenicellales bacterium]